MTSYPDPGLQPQYHRQPSLVVPIGLTAAGAAAMFGLPAMFEQDVDGCCLQNCCGSLVAIVLGLLPVVLYRRSGGHATPGIGCLGAFVGVGVGGLVGAFIQAKFPSLDPGELREMLSQSYDELERAFAQRNQPVEVTREAFISQAETLAPYFPIVIAVGASLMAGVLGMFAGMMLSRRPPPPDPGMLPPVQV